MADTPKPPSVEKPADSKVIEPDAFKKRARIEALLHKMNEQYSVILRGSQVLVMRYWIGEDGKSKMVLLKKMDFLVWQENNRIWVDEEDDKTKLVVVAKRWLEWRDRRNYEEVYFEPQGAVYPLRFNLWRGFAFPDPSPAGEFNLFLEHIENNICSGDEALYAWVMAWLADLFQKPAYKPGTAIVLRGKMGIGKGVFANHIGVLLGIHYMSITQPSQLTGKFNGHMTDKILMFVDEGWWNDERNGMGTLNALITEPKIAAEMKGKDVIYIDNFTRFIIAANADRIVQTGLKDERRMGMLDVSEAHLQDKPYFAAIENQLKANNNAGYKALLNHLLTMPYDESLPRTIPETQALQDHRLYSMPEEVKWLQECLIFGKIDLFQLGNQLNNNIETEKFYFAYTKYCERMKIRPLSVNILPKKIKSFIELNKKRKSLVFESGYEYHLKDIDALRRDFEAGLGQQIEW